MSVAHWSRTEATGFVAPSALDELDDIDVLVLDGVGPDDDPALGWCRHAPCVVAAVGEASSGPHAVDVVVDEVDVDRVVDRVRAHPQAARTLVDVLRVLPDLGVAAGLVVESLAYSMLLGGEEFASWLTRQPARAARSSAEPPVRIERPGDELRVTLARPEARNAFSASLRDGLVEALSVAAADASIGRVVVDADGPCFSSGGDLTEFGTAADVVRAHQIRTLRSVGVLLDRLGDRAEVRVHGRCVGAGVELPAFAARVVADSDTTLRLPEVEMGLIPGAGGTVSLTRRLGRQRTAALALLGDEVPVTAPLVSGYADTITS